MNTKNKVILMCIECGFCETGSKKEKLLNKVVMWKHMKKAHPHTADIMTRYKAAPHEPYRMCAA